MIDVLELRKGDQFRSNGTLIWTAESDAHQPMAYRSTYYDVEVIVRLASDGSRGKRYWKPGSRISVVREVEDLIARHAPVLGDPQEPAA